jgi:hypothetical protein
VIAASAGLLIASALCQRARDSPVEDHCDPCRDGATATGCRFVLAFGVGLPPGTRADGTLDRGLRRLRIVEMYSRTSHSMFFARSP